MSGPNPATTEWVPLWDTKGALAPAHHVTHEPGGLDALVGAAWVGLPNVFSLVQQVNAGLKFPAANVDASDPNTLDDFEEGTWTPTFTGGTTAPTGQTYSVQTGMYTKVGRQVFASFKCQISNVGSGGAGQLRIMGLPFANNALAPSAGVISFYDQLTGITTITLSPHIAPNAAYFIVWYFGGQGISPSGGLLYTQLANTAQIIGSVTFMVT